MCAGRRRLVFCFTCPGWIWLYEHSSPRPFYKRLKNNFLVPWDGDTTFNCLNRLGCTDLYFLPSKSKNFKVSNFTSPWANLLPLHLDCSTGVTGICQNSFFLNIGICQDWNLSELEIVRTGICRNWKFSELEFVRIGICPIWKLSELELVRIGTCENWNLWELAMISFGAKNAM